MSVIADYVAGTELHMCGSELSVMEKESWSDQHAYIAGPCDVLLGTRLAAQQQVAGRLRREAGNVVVQAVEVALPLVVPSFRLVQQKPGSMQPGCTGWQPGLISLSNQWLDPVTRPQPDPWLHWVLRSNQAGYWAS
jgi:hypothetical protein